MKFSSRASFAICCILLPVIALGQGATESSQTKSLNRIFEAIPFEGKLAEPPEVMHSQFSQNPFGLPSGQNKKMMNLFQEAFSTDALVADAKAAFRKNYSPKFANSALDWFSASSNQKLVEAQKEFYTLQGIRKRVVNKHELAQNPAGEKRQQLIDSLAGQKSAVKAVLQSQSIIFRALVSAYGEMSKKRTLSSTQIDGIVKNFRTQSSAQVQQDVRKDLLLMYHGLENAALKEKISFYETKAGKWLNKTTTESIHSAYRSAADRFLKSVRNL